MEWIKKQKNSWPPTFSVAVPFVLIILAVGIFPILLQGSFLSGTVRQGQIDNRRAEVLNQCKIISSKMTRSILQHLFDICYFLYLLLPILMCFYIQV